jgi:hypothetical protein
MADEEMAPRAKAVEAATSGRPELAQAWALISIADDVAAIRRDVEWQRRHGRAKADRMSGRG